MGEGLTRNLEPKSVPDQLKPTEKARQPSRRQLGTFFLSSSAREGEDVLFPSRVGKASMMRMLTSSSLLMSCSCVPASCSGLAARRGRSSVAVRCSESQAQVAYPGKRAEQFSRGLVIPARLIGQESLNMVRSLC